jgi:hypothetical protein
LHAPGAVRYNRAEPSQVCPEGFLHYLPHVSYVCVVDRASFERGEFVALPDGSPGVLLMTRLSAGRDPIVAYVNDAGDLGITRDGGDGACACGSSLPSFRLGGKISGCLSNRLGDTLFYGRVRSGVDGRLHCSARPC